MLVDGLFKCESEIAAFTTMDSYLGFAAPLADAVAAPAAG